MKLDARIKENKMPLTCFHTGEAKTFKGQRGYFSFDISLFEDLSRCHYGVLDYIDSDSEPYRCNGKVCYDFFLPEVYTKTEIDEVSALKNKVKELEKKVIELQRKLNNQETIYNPFTPWTNCCSSIIYPDGFNPQANWCKSLE